MFTKKFYIESSDVDSSLNLKISSMLRMMQDVATEHAEKINLGKKNTIDKGYFWVITRYSISIYDTPKYLETIKVSTYPGEDNKFFYPRHFLIENEKGEVLANANSIWVVLEKEKRRPVLNPFPDIKIKSESYMEEEPTPKKVSGENEKFIEERKVRYSDVDLNGHLNNTKYMEYVLDLKPTSFYKEHKITHIDINYEKELLDGDVLSLYSNNSNPEYILGKCGDNKIIELEIKYE